MSADDKTKMFIFMYVYDKVNTVSINYPQNVQGSSIAMLGFCVGNSVVLRVELTPKL